jgi:hypothetical protein
MGCLVPGFNPHHIGWLKLITDNKYRLIAKLITQPEINSLDEYIKSN